VIIAQLSDIHVSGPRTDERLLRAAFDEIDLNLDEIFEAYVIGRKEPANAEPPLERVA